MFHKEFTLKLNAIVLSLLALMDLFRGYMHTFNIKWASAHVAQIAPNPDSLFLMGAFGMSNFLTGFIYLIIVWKAKHIAPYVLLVIPVAYLLGLLGLQQQGVHMESAFNGQYMMYVYLGICFITSIFYFTAKK